MTTKNLFDQEAREKIKQLATGIDFAMMLTALGKKPVHIAPMSTKKVDEDGAIWFLSGRLSEHNRNIEMDNEIQLAYSNPSTMEFLNVFGRVNILTTPAIITELYAKTDDTWFNGPEDPNVCALQVLPTHAYYWDPKHGKLVTLLKMGFGAITGVKVEVSNEGALKL